MQQKSFNEICKLMLPIKNILKSVNDIKNLSEDIIIFYIVKLAKCF